MSKPRQESASRRFLMATGLVLPSAILLISSWLFTWVSPGGRALLFSLLKRKQGGGIILVLLAVYILGGWLLHRSVADKREKNIPNASVFRNPDSTGSSIPHSSLLQEYAHKLTGLFLFLIFSTVWISFFLLKDSESNHWLKISWPASLAYLILSFTALLYSVLNGLAAYLYKSIHGKWNHLYSLPSEKKRRNKAVLMSCLLLFLLLVIANSLIPNHWLIVLSIILMQVVFPFVMRFSS